MKATWSSIDSLSITSILKMQCTINNEHKKIKGIINHTKRNMEIHFCLPLNEELLADVLDPTLSWCWASVAQVLERQVEEAEGRV